MSSSTRPTLPSLRSLGLPMGMDDDHVSHIDSSHPLYPRMDYYDPHPRNVSPSSSISSTSSRTPSPTPSTASSSTSSYSSLSENIDPLTLPQRIAQGARVRFCPCSLDIADAVVLVPPPNPLSFPPSSSSQPLADSINRPQPLILFNDAIQRHLKHPERTTMLARGAKIMPYKVRWVVDPDTQRRVKPTSQRP